MKKAVGAIVFGLLILGGLFVNHAKETDEKWPKRKTDPKDGAQNPPATTGITGYCPQIFEYSMNNGGTTYYYYRCLICDPESGQNGNPVDNCFPADVMTDKTYTTGGTCDTCGGACTDVITPGSGLIGLKLTANSLQTKFFDATTKKQSDYACYDLCSCKFTRPTNQVDQQEYLLTATDSQQKPVTINGTQVYFRCVDVEVDNQSRLDVGLQLAPSAVGAAPSTAKRRNAAGKPSPDAPDGYHHVLSTFPTDSGEQSIDFYVHSKDPITWP